MKRLSCALVTTALAVVLGGGVVGSASADDSGLSSAPEADSAAPYHPSRASTPKRALAAQVRSGFGRREPAPRVVLLDAPEPESPPLPLAVDVVGQSLGRGLSTEPALVASLVALGGFISSRRRAKLARRGAWAP